jgi:hypothetical protein
MTARGVGRAVAAAFGLLLLVPSGSAWAQRIHSLVVGIDAYTGPGVSALLGAVNDARRIEGVLRPLSAEFVLLLDAAATRPAMLDGWNRILNAAAPGDVLIWTFAGHGTQVEEARPGTEADRRDEVLMAVDFDPRTPEGRSRVIRDDEIEEMLAEAGRRQLRVVLVMDACHSGTLTRTLGRLGTRFFDSGDLDANRGGVAETVAAAATTVVVEEPPVPPHVLYLSGARDNETVKEVMIEDRPGGALSYAFTQALRGAAADDLGRITRGRLGRAVLAIARQFTQAEQTPSVTPVDPEGEVLFRVPVRGQPSAVERTPVRLAVEGRDAAAASALIRGIDGAVPVPDGAVADLTWTADGRIVETNGNVMTEGVAADGLQAVVDRAAALRMLHDLASRRFLRTDLEPGDAIHAEGTRLTWTAQGFDYDHVIVFSFAGDGTVQFHYPLRSLGDPLRLPDRGDGLRLEFEASAPFGADHMVAVAFERLDARALADLQALDKTRRPLSAATVVARLAERTRIQIGIHPFFTKAAP